MLRLLFNFCSNIQIKGSKLQNINLRQSKRALCNVNNSVMSDSVTPWPIACQTPLPMEFSLQESVQFSSVTQSCPTLCDPLNCYTPGFSFHHQLREIPQTYVPWVSDAIQLSSSFIPFSSYLHSFPASIRVFSNESVLHIRWPSVGASASASVLPLNILDWFSLGLTGLISL